MSSVIGKVHGRYVMTRRVRILSTWLREQIPPDSRVLDVGSGDGSIARAIADARPDLRIEGVDVLIRSSTSIPTTQYDGLRLPFVDDSFDVIMLVDVLHHADNAGVVLREAARVARNRVLIKDHQTDGWGSKPTLRLMDWVGNAPHGVALPYNYLSRAQWLALFEQLDLRVEEWRQDLHLYPWPATWLFDRSLHALITVAKRNGLEGESQV
jgi:SAM-dependent methyltransferase